MSTGHGRLCEAVDKAQPIAPDETVEVLAMDLAETLAYYRRMTLEISDLRAANRDSGAHFEQLREEHTALAHMVIDLRDALNIARTEMETCKCDGTDFALSAIDAIVKPNVGGEARLAAHQPSHTTTATPQGVASTDQLGGRVRSEKD